MKKFVILVLLLSLGLSTAIGCGGGKTPPGMPPPAEKDKK